MKSIFLCGCLFLACMTCSGCATGKAGGDKAIQLAVSTQTKPSCQRLTDLDANHVSRARALKELKLEAVSRGANHLQLISIKVGSVTRKYSVQGIAYRCP